MRILKFSQGTRKEEKDEGNVAFMVTGKHKLIFHSPSFKAEEIVAFRLHTETARDAMKITFSFQIFCLLWGYFFVAHDVELVLTSRKPISNSARKQF